MNEPEHVEPRTVIRFAEEEVLRPLLRALGIDAYIEIRRREEGTLLSLEHGTESGRLIGRDGHTLAAIQHLVNVLVAHRFGTTRLILIDCAGYRERHKSDLQRIAKDAGRQALRTGEPVTLEPMVAADRRTVHTALRDWTGVETTSVDEDEEAGTKRVQIIPLGAAPPPRDETEQEAEPAEPLPPDDEDKHEAPLEPSPPVEE